MEILDRIRIRCSENAVEYAPLVVDSFFLITRAFMEIVMPRFIESTVHAALLSNLLRITDGTIPIPAQDADHVYRIMRTEWRTGGWKEAVGGQSAEKGGTGDT